MKSLQHWRHHHAHLSEQAFCRLREHWYFRHSDEGKLAEGESPGLPNEKRKIQNRLLISGWISRKWVSDVIAAMMTMYFMQYKVSR